MSRRTPRCRFQMALLAEVCRLVRQGVCTRRDWQAPEDYRYSQRLVYPVVVLVGSLESVAVPAGRAEPDWDRSSSSYRLCLADARRSAQLPGAASTTRIPQAVWARLDFILGFIYGVL